MLNRGIKDKKIEVDFMTPTRDVIGKVTSTNFDLEDSKLAIFDTKKLLNLTINLNFLFLIQIHF